MTAFVPGGPQRYLHQRRGLRKLIDTKGVAALLFDPGLGKTAVVLDYVGLLALKSPLEEARVLVVCPLVAVDTWVTQAETFISPQVGFWAEALSGSLLERAEALAARGGQPYTVPLVRSRPTPPAGWIRVGEGDLLKPGAHQALCLRCGARKQAVRASTVDRWWRTHLEQVHPDYRPRGPRHARRALHHDKAVVTAFRHPQGYALPDGSVPALSRAAGPDAVGGPRVVLEVINLDTLASRAAFGSRTMADVMLGAIQRFAPDMIVVDESHKIKSDSGNASLLLARTVPFVRRRAILTGTVTPAGPLDVFAQWRFLDPYAFGSVASDGTPLKATLEDFKERYVQYGGWERREIKGYRNLDHLQRTMALRAVVAQKEDALDLPPTTEVVLRVDLSPAEAKAYAEMKKHLVTLLPAGGAVTAENRLVQLLRLRQITSGHLPEDRGPTRVIGTSKAQMIKSLVQDTLAGERRVVIFCLFSHEIKTLAELLGKDSGTQVMVIEGSTPAADRRTMRHVFGDVEAHPQRIVMIAQIKTMSLAVNELVSASHAIFGSLSQQRDDLIQAKDRLNRIGQKRPVTFWYALAPGTVDEVIMKSHRERTNLEDDLLAHIADAG